MSDLERTFLQLSRLGTVFENLCFLEPNAVKYLWTESQLKRRKIVFVNIRIREDAGPSKRALL